MMRLLILFLGVAGLFSACGGSAAESDPTAEAIQSKSVAKEQLLQGTWVSDADANVSWTFASGQLTEALKGAQDRRQSGAYTLSDDCLNGDGNGATTPAGYLNLVNPDRCFFIVSLTDEALTLSYVGRGNTLRFRKQ